MLPAEQDIIRYKRLIAKSQSGDPQDELDDSSIDFMILKIQELRAGLEDYYDGKIKDF